MDLHSEDTHDTLINLFVYFLLPLGFGWFSDFIVFWFVSFLAFALPWTGAINRPVIVFIIILLPAHLAIVFQQK